jgi:predicted amidohydrolase YtcJ
MYWAEDRVGSTRIKGAYAWRKLLDTGAHFTSGSDTPVEKAGALLQLYAARTRQDTTGWPKEGWYADQRLSGLEALRSMTSWAAYAAFEDSFRGMIVPGYDADITVLSGNPALEEPTQLLDIAILLTIVNGEIVWKNKPALRAQQKK